MTEISKLPREGMRLLDRGRLCPVIRNFKSVGRFAAASRLVAAVVSLLLLVSSASELTAASPDAWEDFRRDVKTKMESAVKGKLVNYGLFIEPHGSESYGVAIASGVSAGDKLPLTIIGIYDKASQKLEIVEVPGMTLKSKRTKERQR